MENLPIEERRQIRKNAAIYSVLSHPQRLEILHLLRKNEKMHVNQLAKLLKMKKSNLSQHLSLMKDKRLIKAEKRGIYTYYSLKNYSILKLCDLLSAS